MTSLVSGLFNWIKARVMKRKPENKFPPGGISSQQKEGGEYVVPMRVTTTITKITCTGNFPPRGIFSFDDPETSLEIRLRIAIENEDYKEAARLRDEIKKQEDANN